MCKCTVLHVCKFEPGQPTTRVANHNCRSCTDMNPDKLENIIEKHMQHDIHSSAPIAILVRSHLISQINDPSRLNEILF